MKSSTTLLWFRRDLRLADNPALAAAVARGRVLPVFVFDEQGAGSFPLGGAQRWWLHRSLQALSAQLQALGSRLVLRAGVAADVLRQLVEESGAEAVCWNRSIDPVAIDNDSQLKTALRARGIVVQSFNAGLLHEPWEIQNQSGGPYQVFTPYWRQCLKLSEPAEPLAAPATLPAPARWPESASLADLQLLPAIPWYGGMEQMWTPGESGAQDNLDEFLHEAVWHYANDRDRPAKAGSSQLSPHLHFGEISPRQIWHGVRARALRERTAATDWRAHPFLREVYWREFAHHLLFHFPHTVAEPLRAEFTHFPWRSDAASLHAWQRGRTGVPLVDAGMRQLWQTGWMHNRVRMIAGSFLVKNLLLSWQDGAEWFRDTLVDADLASNTLGWQWCAGSGADAAPYFRIFNPASQGQKFDSDGAYVRRWVPELAGLPARYIHAPWEAPAQTLRDAGVVLGGNYPPPIVDLKASRARALDAFAQMRRRGPGSA